MRRKPIIQPYCTKEQKLKLLALYNHPSPIATDWPYIFKPLERDIIRQQINRLDEAEADAKIKFLENRIEKLTTHLTKAA